jgi:hypothetical protein
MQKKHFCVIFYWQHWSIIQKNKCLGQHEFLTRYLYAHVTLSVYNVPIVLFPNRYTGTNLALSGDDHYSPYTSCLSPHVIIRINDLCLGITIEQMCAACDCWFGYIIFYNITDSLIHTMHFKMSWRKTSPVWPDDAILKYQRDGKHFWYAIKLIRRVPTMRTEYSEIRPDFTFFRSPRPW